MNAEERRSRAACAGAVAVLLWVPPVCAQVSASLSGYVFDPGRRPVPHAVVAAQGAGMSRAVPADGAGYYIIPELPPAGYTISVSSPGFAAARQYIDLDVGARRRQDFVLAIAQRRDTVEVSAALPSESSGRGVVLDRQRIDALPLNRRDFLQLALLAPGVMPPVENSELSSRGRFAMHASGAREEANNYLLDGVDNNDLYENTYVVQPPVDSIQEFEIATNTYSAEYGRNGGGQVNVVTRAGGSQWHGTAYEYLRNRDLDARNFFDGADKPGYIRNQFGAGAGGPLWKDRSFLYANFDGLRARQGLTRLATVPTPAERNSVPAGRVSPIAQRILDLFPLPNLPGASGNYLAQPIAGETSTQGNLRWDHMLSAHARVTVRYSYGTQDLFEPYTHDSSDVPGFGDYVTNTGHNALVQYQQVFGPRVVNSLRLGFNRSFRHVLPQNYNVDVGRLWGVDWLNVRPRDFGFPAINVAGFSVIGDQTQVPIARYTNTYELGDGLALVRGSHELKLGGEVRHVRCAGLLDYYARGSLSFSGAITGSGIGDLLMGYPSFGIQSQFDNPETLRATAYAGYVQDDWKPRPSLALNLGLRYEYNTPPVDPTNRMSVFEPATQKIVNVGTAGVSRSGIRPDRNNFAPRAGLAWTPAAGWVVRGGYGVYYDSGMLVVNSSLYFNPPYFNVRVFFPTRASLLTLNDPFPAQGGSTPPPSPNTLSPDLTTAYVQHWNASLERQVTASTVASLAYVASKGTHLIRSRDLNQPEPGPGVLQTRRPLPDFGGIFYIESGGNSSYQSLEASLNRRLARRVSLLAAYTFGKSIDDTSAFLVTNPDKNFPQDSHNYRGERGLSSYDMRQRFTAAWTYQAPGRSWWNRNFELRGIATAQAGQPFTPYLRFDNSNTGNSGGVFGLDRPDLLRDPALAHPSPDRWFDTSAFAIPAKDHFGDAGRNILTGPGLFSVDLALSRRFVPREGLALIFDAQAFNLLNRAQFDLPNNYADEPANFGRIFSAKAPRQVQFAVRLNW